MLPRWHQRPTSHKPRTKRAGAGVARAAVAANNECLPTARKFLFPGLRLTHSTSRILAFSPNEVPNSPSGFRRSRQTPPPLNGQRNLTSAVPVDRYSRVYKHQPQPPATGPAAPLGIDNRGFLGMDITRLVPCWSANTFPPRMGLKPRRPGLVFSFPVLPRFGNRFFLGS